ncbi:MAG: poly(3-hydroxyalkanoate) depolymerase [Burkholderiaceae bacterium]
MTQVPAVQESASDVPLPWADETASDGLGISKEMLKIGSQVLRVARKPGRSWPGPSVPLLLFNGIGANLELLEPLALALKSREVIIFDIPGIGKSPMPRYPYRLRHIVHLACGVLDHYDHQCCDVLGVSWGGAVAQQFVHTAPERCRRLILCATASGVAMVPPTPKVLATMLTPRRYTDRTYGRSVSGRLYGGDFRRFPDVANAHFKNVTWQSGLGYYLQLGAVWGWTSIHWLRRVEQPTLVMGGAEDPLVPLANAQVLHRLIPNSELKVFDCGHLFLLTRLAQSVEAITKFLDAPAPAQRSLSMSTEAHPPAPLAIRLGAGLGVSDWILVDQSRIDQFAQCTGDHQWIHVDVEKAARESGFGSTIAHGYLTLALLAPTTFEVLTANVTARQIMNYGLERVRFITPVGAGKRIRNRVRFIGMDDKGDGRYLLTLENTVEIEGESKPALVATTLALLIQ